MQTDFSTRRARSIIGARNAKSDPCIGPGKTRAGTFTISTSFYKIMVLLMLQRHCGLEVHYVNTKFSTQHCTTYFIRSKSSLQPRAFAAPIRAPRNPITYSQWLDTAAHVGSIAQYNTPIHATEPTFPHPHYFACRW